MSNQRATSHRHFASACDSFALAHNLTAMAADIGMSGHVLHNKFNPACERHKLNALDLIALYHASGDDTLFKGLLLDCDLTAVAIHPSLDSAPLTHRVIDATARVAGVGAQVVQLLESGRVTSRQRIALGSALRGAIGQLVLIATEVENKFQAVPNMTSAVDLTRAAIGA